ncbi:phospholipase D-like domain-containing protein [Zestomonas carbonaria]|uniref:phospholipase D-like domain-containing protein n=1 Tax=Zestomonas carbonaria TaxID=2762745 RepID=UPI0016570D52|nr:phospholipase D family protein [Pseudomonas carbonaria]
MSLPVGTDTALDRLVSPADTQVPGKSGFRLVHDGMEAFALRVHSANLAGRSLDVQTYIWHEDQTGLYLVHVLLKAADRGVRVRLLVDDMDARAKHYGFAALSAHPNIAVRHFNPFSSRYGTVSKVLEALQSFNRINHRMHNKTWIADGRLAVAGGRNLGDEYFDASPVVNFSDLDFAMVGPVVKEAAESFDRYWNASVTYPVELLAPGDVTEQALAELRAKLDPYVARITQGAYAQALRQDDAVQRLIKGDWPMDWSDDYQFISDDPLKVRGIEQGLYGSKVLAGLLPAVKSSRERLSIISPYFVPGKLGMDALTERAGAGSRVRVLTNSLAANDVVAVHGGYTKYRKPLIAGGVQLWELKPRSHVRASLFGSSGASLHTKAMVIDRSQVFVGSYNLDARSAVLNCEQGILVRHPDLAEQLEALFERQITEFAWAVTLERGDVRWSDGKREYESEPYASMGRRALAWLTRVLPIESQL